MQAMFKGKIWRAAWQGGARFFVLGGLPLIAWGLDDVPGFLANPARAAFIAIIAGQALLHTALTYLTPPPPHMHRIDLASWHAYFLEIILILAAFGDRRESLTLGEDATLRWLGLIIYAAGAGLSVWTNLTWTRHRRQQADRAVDDPALLSIGPFRWVQFPALLGLIAYGLGAALVFRSSVGLVLVLPLIAGTLNHIRALDHLLLATYTDAWSQRRRAAKRLVPWVY